MLFGVPLSDSAQINNPCASDIGLLAEVASEGYEVEVGLEPIVTRASGLAEGFRVVGGKLVGFPIDDAVGVVMSCDFVDETLQEALKSVQEPSISRLSAYSGSSFSRKTSAIFVTLKRSAAGRWNCHSEVLGVWQADWILQFKPGRTLSRRWASISADAGMISS
jgi:hypothetical protein